MELKSWSSHNVSLEKKYHKTMQACIKDEFYGSKVLVIFKYS